ncbi:malto-oligosyltrehalose synthase [Agrobacterium larrymoorei]|uniref:malto-oligosyltrehalose synthase n=1 Tax=Agrobacterium larrymoorei TaxID=160699 RepID=UPI001574D821|nr:malto-oligosyltrehalose synthase [Agrobacterium larrymoorei]NTJ41903.1 malto-oligosyltrehalose synthase [Agrobacterium larrymoorei]
MSIPTATYRLQFRDGMTFDRATAIIPYLKKLGISHLYASPIFTATSGSTHGYDVTDANEIDPAIGGRDGFERLVKKLKEEGLELILDIVPNHMAASLENSWWRDVLEHGKNSEYAGHFDIDWSRRLTLPVLGEDFEEALAMGEITIEQDPSNGKPALRYFNAYYPIDPVSIADQEGELLVAADTSKISEIHDRQAYRLMCWRDAKRDLSYRRFFEVTGLAGIRVEDEKVFNDSHRLILELVRNGSVTGLRIDHIDGLADPKGYLERLRREVGPDCYITVEKILGEEEQLPSDWPVSGTTGYEFIAALSNLFTDDEKLDQLRAAYAETKGRNIDMREELRNAKVLMADHNFKGEFLRLLSLATEILRAEPHAQQWSEDNISAALRELVVSFPVYRTYGTTEGLPLESDRVLTEVIETINSGAHAQDQTILKAFQRLLRGETRSETEQLASEFRIRFQQLTGPLMAKSVEDTLFYRQNAALALNEVGAEPLPSTYSVNRFHDEMVERLQSQPDGLSTTSTHDTKRGEDARARLYTVTEAPTEWQRAFQRWQSMNASLRTYLDDGVAPEASVEWMLYQALLGVWPHNLVPNDIQGLEALEERFIAYVEKALREAKLRTNWGDSSDAYEQAVLAYVEKLLAPENIAFLKDFQETSAVFMEAGLSNSLSQTLIKLTAPGVADIYQGCDGLDFSLVDPDNRRMPDFDALSKRLDAQPAKISLTGEKIDPAIKQHLIALVLNLRKAAPDLFRKGDYLPLSATGRGTSHVVSFARQTSDDAVIVIAPRLVLDSLQRGTSPFDETSIALPRELANQKYVDVLTGAEWALEDAISLSSVVKTPYLALLRKLRTASTTMRVADNDASIG